MKTKATVFTVFGIPDRGYLAPDIAERLWQVTQEPEYVVAKLRADEISALFHAWVNAERGLAAERKAREHAEQRARQFEKWWGDVKAQLDQARRPS